MDLVWTIIIQLVLSYVATVTFAIITNVPKRALNACGITGTFGWMAYWTLMQMDSGTGASSLAGAFVVAVLSHFLRNIRNCQLRFLMFRELSRSFLGDLLTKLCVILY